MLPAAVKVASPVVSLTCTVYLFATTILHMQNRLYTVFINAISFCRKHEGIQTTFKQEELLLHFLLQL